MKTGTYYDQALRYIDSAEAELKKSGKDEEGKYYSNKKHVKCAGGIAYAGILQAAKWYIALKGIAINDDADEREIKTALAKLNRNAYLSFDHFYSYLHCSVHQHGNSNVFWITDAMKKARDFIALLKPEKA